MIIGEAASKVSPETETHPELCDLPWRDIVGIRNRLIHVYFDVDLDILWATIQRDLPPLIRALESALAPSIEI